MLVDAITDEVILAAGALESPKILELSGVGNEELFESHGIDAAVLSYVKQNRRSIVLEGISSIAYLPLTNVQNQAGSATLKVLFGKYPAIKDPNFHLAEQYCDITRSCLECPREGSAAYSGAVSKTIGPDPKISSSIFFMLSQPLSRGNVHISCSSPEYNPIVDPRYSSHPLDMEIYARRLQFLTSLVSLDSPIRTRINLINKHPMQNHFDDIEVAKEFVRRTGFLRGILQVLVVCYQERREEWWIVG